MAQNVINNGIACCDCTCANLANMKWAAQYLNVDILAQFNQQIYKTTGNPGFAPSQSQPQSSPAQSGGTTTQAASESSGSAGGAENSLLRKVPVPVKKEKAKPTKFPRRVPHQEHQNQVFP